MKLGLVHHHLGLPPIVPGLRIGLLGGSFDPPHMGHVHLSHWAFRILKLDRIVWLISPQNPLKSSSPASLPRRLHQALELAKHPHIWVSDIERQIGSIYTVATIQFLTTKFPQAKFCWLMGSDNWVELHRWHQWKTIARLVPIAVFPRNHDRASAINCHSARLLHRARLKAANSCQLMEYTPPIWTLLNFPLCDYSSTTIRNRGEWRR